jgi:hypothetical protein
MRKIPEKLSGGLSMGPAWVSAFFSMGLSLKADFYLPLLAIGKNRKRKNAQPQPPKQVGLRLRLKHFLIFPYC